MVSIIAWRGGAGDRGRVGWPKCREVRYGRCLRTTLYDRPGSRSQSDITHTLWGVPSFMMFCLVFFTCSTGRWADTACSYCCAAQSIIGTFERKEKKTSRMKGCPRLYSNSVLPMVYINPVSDISLWEFGTSARTIYALGRRVRVELPTIHMKQRNAISFSIYASHERVALSNRRRTNGTRDICGQQIT